VLGVTVDGERDILELWAGDGGEGAKYWPHVLTEAKNRGVGDVCIVVCDGLRGLPDDRPRGVRPDSGRPAPTTAASGVAPSRPRACHRDGADPVGEDS
jgi:hypothetical protein